MYASMCNPCTCFGGINFTKDLLRVLVCPLNLIVVFWTGVAGAKSTHNLIYIIKDDSKKKFWKKICFSASKLIKAYMSFFAYICHLTIFAYILALIIHFEAYFRFNWTYICTFPGWVGVWDGWVGCVGGWLVGWLGGIGIMTNLKVLWT